MTTEASWLVAAPRSRSARRAWASQPLSPGTTAQGRTRWRSLDAIRGLAVGGMVVVNAQGSPTDKLPGLAHPDWNGFTLADLVFPTFLAVAGAALQASGAAERFSADQLPRLGRRTAVLALTGLALGAFPWFGWGDVRIMGVLQRIALCSILGIIALRWLTPRQQVVISGGVLSLYAVLYLAVPGGLSQDGNVSMRIDSLLLGASHLYSPRGDPEGLATTPLAVISVLVGAWAVRLLRSRGAGFVAAAGVACVGVGAIGALWLPVNKFLWTPTFVLVSGGVTALLIAVVARLVDGVVGARPRARWSLPLETLGRNALVAYVGSELLAAALRSLPAPGGGRMLRAAGQDALSTLLPAPISSLVYALAVLAVWWAVCAWLSRRRVFVSA